MEALTEYHFQLRSSDEAGNWSAPSNEAIGWTLGIIEREPPERITSLAVIDSSQYSLTLRWVAPADPPSGGAATRYELMQQKDGSGIAWTFWTLPAPTTPGTEQTYVVSHLDPGTGYHFTLRSVDECGNWSAPSNEVRARTRLYDPEVCAPFDFDPFASSPRPTVFVPIEKWFRGVLGNPPSPSGGTDCPGLTVSASSAYGAPACHPSGTLLAFNHIPITGIDWPYGPDCYSQFRYAMDREGLWIAGVDGSNERRIAPLMLVAPEWSPNGDWIAGSLGHDLCSIRFLGDRLDGSSIVRLACQGGGNAFPAWNPDGNLVAYVCDREDNGWPTLWLVGADGTGRRRLASPGMMPSWSPDGEHIVYLGWEGDIYRVSIQDTSAVERLTSFGPGTFNWTPKVSPDGRRIAFLSTFDTIGRYRIWLIDDSGGGLALLSTMTAGSSFFGSGLSWSPDGSTIFFEYYDSVDWTYTNSTIWAVDVATKLARQITYNPEPQP